MGKSYFEVRPDGKFAFVTDFLPKLLFVSKTGHGDEDQVFVQGQELMKVRSAVIQSSLEHPTTYAVSYYADDELIVEVDEEDEDES